MANVTIADLTAASGVTADDLLFLHNDPSGTPASQKATAAQMLAYIEGAISVPVGSINATGTASSSTFLRGDGSWQAVSGGSGDLVSTNNLSDLDNANTARINLGVALGSDVQAYDANLPTWPSTVDATEVGYLNGVTSAIQTQLDAKAASSHNHATSEVTSGTFADARISESSVTQHEDALTITESQVSDLGSYIETLALSGLSDVDSSVSSPSNGDILVYRSAGSDWVLEAKPAAGSNPAAADISDATADGIALITSSDANPFTDADETKLDGIEAAADVTDATNVAAAGALMDSEVTNLADVKAFDPADYEAADADILKADVGDNLTAGYTSDAYAHGTITTGTVTPAPATGQENFQTLTNGGAFTLAPPASNCSIVIQVTNNGSAGTVTTSGFDNVDGDTISTTDADDFFFYITVCGSKSSLTVKAL